MMSMNRSKTCPLVVLAAIAMLLGPGHSWAQEGPVTFEFSFSNPGARSLGMGGAFAALADDATAAFANPAGLVQLRELELSLESRRWERETPFVEGGRISGMPSGLGIDTATGIRTGRAVNDVSALSFASFVLPRETWSLAVYRHTLADFSLQSHVNGLFGFDEDGEDARSEDVLARTDVEVINLGVAGAWQITPTLSIGAGIVHFDAMMDSISVEYGLPESRVFEANPFTPDLIDTSYFHQSDTKGFTYSAGFLWRPHPSWSVGGYYRQGPELDFRVREVVGPLDDEQPAGTIELDAITPLNLPDVFGLGLAWRSEDGRWTSAFEWTRVNYSSITDDLDTAVFDPGQIHIDDGNEFHVGIERVFLATSPVVAVRLGAWLDPAHSVGSGPTASPFERAIFPGGDDQLHVVAGLGLAFEHFQLDLGLDFSDAVDTASLSFVYRF